MSILKSYVVVKALVCGKKIIKEGEPLPSDAPSAKIKSWLDSGAIKETGEQPIVAPDPKVKDKN